MVTPDMPTANLTPAVPNWAERIGFGAPEAWRLFARYFGPHRNALLAYAVAAALPAVAIVPVLMLVRLAFDTAIPQSNVGLLIGVGVAIILIRLVGTAAALALRLYIVRLTKSTIARMRADLLERLYQIERSALTRADIDRLQNQVVQDTERLDVLVSSLFSGLLPAACTSLALLALLAFLNWPLVLAAALSAPLILLGAHWTQKRVGRDVRIFQGDFERFNRGVSFILRQMDLTRTQAYQQQELARQQQVVRDLAHSGERMAWSFALHGNLQGTATGILGICLLVAGGLEVMSGVMTLGQFLAFYLGAGMLSGAILSLTRGSADVVAMGISLTTLAALDAKPIAAPYGGTTRIDFTGHLSLRDVHFRYDDAMVLRGVDFDVRPGEHVAIIGPNGSGKTTLLNLLVGVLRPLSGQVLADSRPYDELDLEHLRRNIGVVMQRAAFFHGTVRANIAYGEPGASEEAVVAAARLSFADEFIRELPSGYDTVIGDAGLALSGGECQRIALARSLLRRPRVLILDEPTNHLDASVVARILAVLKQLADCPAIIVVSHDPRIVEFVHRSYHLRDGRLTPAPAPLAVATS